MFSFFSSQFQVTAVYNVLSNLIRFLKWSWDVLVSFPKKVLDDLAHPRFTNLGAPAILLFTKSGGPPKKNVLEPTAKGMGFFRSEEYGLIPWGKLT